MKVAEVLQAIQTFFLDFIGAVIPGCILLVGTAVALDSAEELGSVVSRLGDFAWPGLVVATYTLGNIVVGAGGLVVKRRQGRVREKLRSDPSVVSFEQVARNQSGLAESKGQDDAKAFGALRSLALSVTDAGTAITHRFMFIALFHLGSAVAIGLSLLAFWISTLLQWWGVITVHEGPDYVVSGLCSAVSVLVVVLLVLRWDEFYKRSMRVPFSTGLAHLINTKGAEGRAEVKPPVPRIGSRVGPVYLAGGFRSGWQDTVMNRVRHLAFFDPRSHGLMDEGAYTAWDLQAIRQSDIVLAFAEASNPGLYALALEVGFAKALGKQIILVEQHPDEARSRYFGMLRACSDVRLASLEEAIDLLDRSTSPTSPA